MRENKKYIVVHLDDGGDLRREEFDSLEDSRRFIEEEINFLKSYIIKGEFLEDHT